MQIAKFKNQILTIGLLLMVFAFAFAGDGAWVSDRNPYRGPNYPTETLLFQCTVDSIDTLTSDAFNLNKYTHSNWTTFPFHLQYQWTSTLNRPRLNIYIEGTFDQTNWVRVDTVASNDTLETLRRATFNFNNHKYPLYRLIIYGIAGAGALFDNLSDVAATIRIYAYQL